MLSINDVTSVLSGQDESHLAPYTGLSILLID